MAINCSGDVFYNSDSGATNQVYGCRMWIVFNGTIQSVNASRNVSSWTRNSTGNYTISFSSPMPSSSFSYTGMCGSSNDGNRNVETYDNGTGYVRVATYRSSDGSNQDVNHVHVQAFM